MIRDCSVSHRPALERLEPRLPPGDALVGVLLAWRESTPEFDDTRCGRPFESSATVWEAMPGDGLSYSTIRSDGAGVSISQPKERRLTADHPSPAPDDTTYAFAAPDATGVRRGFQNVAARQPATAGGANLDGLTSVAQRNTNPSLALRAGMHSSLDGALSHTQPQSSPPREEVEPPVDESTVRENYGKLELAFEQNVGQTDSRVDFIARAGGYTAFLTPKAAVFSIQNPEFGSQNSESPDGRAGGVNPLEAAGPQGVHTPRSPGIAVHMEIVGANPNAQPTAAIRQPGIVNYFIGDDPSQWHTNISTFGRVEYNDVYPGIDLVYYGKGQQLEYDFIVSPGADPNQIALNFAGADGAEIDGDGNLVLQTAAGDFVQQKPYLYQDTNGVRKVVAGSFVLGTQSSALATFDVGAYDATRPLVIDPLVLGYSTFLGGSGNEHGYGIDVDNTGNAYITGVTPSSNFPTTPGVFDVGFDGSTDAFVTKMRSDGSGLIYSTFLGSLYSDYATAIALDSNGNAYVAGSTSSAGFPTTAGAFQTTYGGGFFYDGFVSKLRPDGAGLLYSTFLGGSNHDFSRAIDLDSGGNAYVTGFTQSNNFPVTPGAFDTTHVGNFLTKVNPQGSELAYSTFLPDVGDCSGIAVDTGGNAFVTGSANSTDFPATPGAFDTTYNDHGDAFVIRLNSAGSALLFATYLGGSSFDEASGIALDGSGHAYVTGRTQGSDFPTTPGAFDSTHNGGADDLFVAKLRSDGVGLMYSTFLGGSGPDSGYGIAVDGNGRASVTGWTESTNFPTTSGAFDPSYNGGSFPDAYVTRLRADGSGLLDSTYLGGVSWDEGWDVAVDARGNVYVTGFTWANNFPTTPGAFDSTINGGYDAFVTKFCHRACQIPAIATQVVP